MHKRTSHFLIILIFVCLSFEKTVAQSEIIISGYVYDSSTNAPLQDVKIEVEETEDVSPALTNQRGRYSIVIPGRTEARITFSKEGYKPATFLLKLTEPDLKHDVRLESAHPKVIWQIGDCDGRFQEFNDFSNAEKWPWKYKVRQSARSFPQEINDFVRSEIHISFNLSKNQVNKGLVLTIATVGGHGKDFTVRFEIQNSKTREILGSLTFDTLSRDRKEIRISSALTVKDEHTIILVKESPPFTDRWLFWDCLSLSEYNE